MSMQLGLQLSDVPVAAANSAGVLEPGQAGVTLERIEVDRKTWAEIAIAHHKGRWFFGLQVQTGTEYTGFCPSIRHPSFEYRFQAVDKAQSRLTLELYRRVGPADSERNDDTAKAARRLLKKVNERFDAWMPDIDERLEIAEARMREDGTWTWDDEEKAA